MALLVLGQLSVAETLSSKILNFLLSKFLERNNSAADCLARISYNFSLGFHVFEKAPKEGEKYMISNCIEHKSIWEKKIKPKEKKKKSNKASTIY